LRAHDRAIPSLRLGLHPRLFGEPLDKVAQLPYTPVHISQVSIVGDPWQALLQGLGEQFNLLALWLLAGCKPYRVL
jgi:hypothetical protein